MTRLQVLNRSQTERNAKISYSSLSICLGQCATIAAILLGSSRIVEASSPLCSNLILWATQDENATNNADPIQGFSLPSQLDQLPSDDPIANKIKLARKNILYAAVAAEQVGPNGRLQSLVKSLESELDRITDPDSEWSGPEREAERLQALDRIAIEAERLAQSISVSADGLALRVSGPIPTAEWFARKGLMSSFNHVAMFDTDLGEEFFEYLVPAKDLESLMINGSENLVTREGLSRLSAFKLKQLNLARTNTHDDAFIDIARFPKLTELHLFETHVTGEVFGHISQLKSLARLDLNRTNVADEGFGPVAELQNLEFLGLSDTHITGESLAHIAGLVRLTRLDLARTKIDDDSLAHLSDLNKLMFLNLQETPLTGTGFQAFSSMDELIFLNLNQTRIGDSAIRALGKVPNLKRIELSSTRVTDASIAHLIESAKLDYVDLFGTHITDASLELLRNQRDITKLFLGGTQITDEGLQHLSRLKAMRELDLRGTRITDEGLRHLAGLLNLNVLRLSGTQVTGEGLQYLAQLDQLNVLDLGGTRVDDDGVASIPSMPSLRVVDLSQTEVTDRGIAFLANNEQLRSVSLDSTSVSNDGIRALRRLPNLRTLNLSDTQIGDDSIDLLAEFPSLSELGLNHTSLSDSGLERMDNDHTRLELANTDVTDEGLHAIQRNDNLVFLDLAETKITDEGLIALSGLAELQFLNLANTQIGDASIQHLAELPSLNQLDLSNTMISDVGAESLLHFHALESLNLERTRITADGSSLLKRGLPDVSISHDHPWEWDQRWTFFEEESTSSLDQSSLNASTLRELNGLTYLHVDDQALTPDLLRSLKDIPDLEYLSFRGTQLDDSDLAELAGLPHLTRLDLSRTQITDSGLIHLAKLESLRELNLRGTSLHGDGLIHLQELSQLSILRLGNTRVNDAGVRFLTHMHSLRRLDLVETEITDATIRDIATLPNLQYVDLFGTNVSDASASSLARIDRLRFCYLSNTNIGDDTVAQLATLPDLEELGLDGTNITDDALESIAQMEHLTRLKIGRTNVSPDGLLQFKAPARLTSLELNDLPVDDDTLIKLSYAPRLRRLDLSGSRINDASMQTMSKWAQLRDLDIRDTSVSEAATSKFTAERPDVNLRSGRTRPSATVASLSLLVIYAVVVLSICFYGTHRLILIMAFLRSRRVRQAPSVPTPLAPLPKVTVQLPMYNESRVARRVIDAACSLDYPRELLQIQVLDDSTDEVAELVRSICAEFQSLGHEIQLLHRDTREGFKGGALREGMESANGEFITMFDADFVPKPDFLQQVLPYFQDKQIGVVQAEWSHLNRDESWLTQCQAIFLDGHFVVEQSVRSHAGRWFNFNGTAGVWRKSCIEESGGWSHDTLTEDTDLSYRAQLAGWRFLYLPHVKCDAEIPSTMTAFLGQQHRWSKGLIQSAKKLMPSIMFSRAPIATRLEAWCHLTAPMMYVVMFVLTLIALPALYVSTPLNRWSTAAFVLGVASLCLGTLSTTAFYLVSQRAQGISWMATLLRLPLLMGIGIGISVVNTQAVIAALIGWRSPFVRTPKFGGRADYDRTAVNPRLSKIPKGWIELGIAGILFACLVLAFLRPFTLIGAPFLLLFALGYLGVGTARIKDEIRARAFHRKPLQTGDAGQAPVVLRPANAVAGAIALIFVAVIATAGVSLGWRNVSDSHSIPSTDATIGVDLTHADWKTGEDSTHAPQRAIREVVFDRGALKLTVELDEQREQGEVYLDLSGPLLSLGSSLDSNRTLLFEVEFPKRFTGELQAFVRDSEGRSEYGSMEFIESHDQRIRAEVSISPSRWMPAMGYRDDEFEPYHGMSQIGLKVAAQSDRVRGAGYRGFQGIITISNIRIEDRSALADDDPEILSVKRTATSRPAPSDADTFAANSGLVRPWPLGYAFSGPLNDRKQEVLDQTFGAIQAAGMSYARIYLGDYRTGLIIDSNGLVIDIEDEFADYVARLIESANQHGVTPLICLTDNTMADGRGIENTELIQSGEPSDRFVERVLMRFVRENRDRNVIWDIFNEPENVTEISLREIQHYVDRVLEAGRATNPDARFTVVSRGREDLVFWGGRGLDLYAHNVFNERSLSESIDSDVELDAPIIVAEIDPELVTVDHIASLRNSGYEAVGVWGWGTDDKYNWNASDIEERVAPLIQSTN